jgi:hypothetical protein
MTNCAKAYAGRSKPARTKGRVAVYGAAAAALVDVIDL